MDLTPKYSQVHFRAQICKKFKCYVWSSYAYYSDGQSSLIKWWVSLKVSLNAIFNACLVRAAHTNKDGCILRWATLTGKKMCFLVEVLMSFYKLRLLWSIILLQTKPKIKWDLYLCILEVHKKSFMPSGEDEDMTWLLRRLLFLRSSPWISGANIEGTFYANAICDIEMVGPWCSREWH
jgi:hypothetical protein